MDLTCLVMAGGQGTRFWPKSTRNHPKQFISFGKQSLLTETFSRLNFIGKSDRYLITTQNLQKKTLLELKDHLDESNCLIEPHGRNTAPCVLYSLAKMVKVGVSLNTNVVILPADHLIKNSLEFERTILKALEFTDESIVTIGITPTSAFTGYGYIQRGQKLGDCSFQVDSFKEKPKKEIAENYFKSGMHYWNAGMFIGKIGNFLEEFSVHCPELFQYFEDMKNGHEVYEKLPKLPIDIAVMEKSSRIVVVESSFDWSDVGSWEAMDDVFEPKSENVWVENNEHYVDNARGNIVNSKKFVSLVNVDNLLVVESEQGLLIMPKSDSQKVKDVVTHLQNHPDGKKYL